VLASAVLQVGHGSRRRG